MNNPRLICEICESEPAKVRVVNGPSMKACPDCALQAGQYGWVEITDAERDFVPRAELDAVQAERDAAVDDLRTYRREFNEH